MVPCFFQSKYPLPQSMNYFVLNALLLFGLYKKVFLYGTSLAVQWLRLHASTAKGIGSVPTGETKIAHALCSMEKKKNYSNTVMWLNIFKSRKGHDKDSLLDHILLRTPKLFYEASIFLCPQF